MARRLYEKYRGNYVGLFAPEGGWQNGRRGIRRTLCSIAEMEHLSELEMSIRLTELYSRKAREITDENHQKEIERKKKKQRKLWTVKQAKAFWLDSVRSTCAEKTAIMYGRSLDLYITACGNHEMQDYDETKYNAFQRYLNTQAKYRGRLLADTTKHTHSRHLKNFLLFCRDKQIIDSLHRIKMPKLPKKDMQTLTLDDLDRLERYLLNNLEIAERECDSRAIRNMKNMLRAYMMATQIVARLGAIWSLKLENIDLASGLIYIRDNKELKWKNKFYKTPDKPINKELYDFLKKDLSERKFKERYYLDKGNGEPWYYDQGEISKLATKIFRELNLPSVKPFHWGMRATMITELLLSGCNPYAVQELADHDNIETTMLYLNRRKIQQKNAVDSISELRKNRHQSEPKVSHFVYHRRSEV